MSRGPSNGFADWWHSDAPSSTTQSSTDPSTSTRDTKTGAGATGDGRAATGGGGGLSEQLKPGRTHSYANKLGENLSKEWNSTNTTPIKAGDGGNWKSRVRSGQRDHLMAMSGHIFDRGASLYRVNLDEGLGTKLFEFRSTFLPNVESLDALRRFTMKVPKQFPLHDTSFGLALFIYSNCVRKIGQYNINKSLLGHLYKIEKLRSIFKRNGRLAESGICDDDFVRKMLKLTSGWAFPKVFSEGPGYMFFMHLETMGGQSPWTEQQILNDITQWTSGELEGDFELLKPYYDQAMREWGKPNKDKLHLTFREYCKDALRWGTSGGARKAKFFGEDFRSKWAWAFSRLIKDDGTFDDDVDLYEHALSEGNTCKVALKEEAKKTRQIITTPMASYLTFFL